MAGQLDVIAAQKLPWQPTRRFFGLGPGHVEKKIVASWRSNLARYLIFYLLTRPPRSRDQIVAAFLSRTVSRAREKSVFRYFQHLSPAILLLT